MKVSLWLAGILLTAASALMFVLVLDAKAAQDQALAVLNTFLAYPIVAYGAFSAFQVRVSEPSLRFTREVVQIKTCHRRRHAVYPVVVSA